MNKKELIAALDKLPDDTIILYQVTAVNGPEAWQMEAKMSGVLDHFKWESPVAILTLSHPNLETLNPVKWKDD